PRRRRAGRVGLLLANRDEDSWILARESCGMGDGRLFVASGGADIEPNVPALLKPLSFESDLEPLDDRRCGGERVLENADEIGRYLRLRPGRVRHKHEAERENKPDPPHEHLGWDGWRESSRPELLAARAVKRLPRRPLRRVPRRKLPAGARRARVLKR